jgi:DNA-binding GntR family transcriptional regulator
LKKEDINTKDGPIENSIEPIQGGGVERLKYGVMLDDTLRKIKEMMYYNELVPGQKIIYSDLAVRLNTSTTPIREALKLLESAKVVQYFPNKGYFVAKITEAEVRQLYEVREALEMLMLPKIVENITTAAIASFHKRFRKLNTMEQRKQLFLDKQFHITIAQYAENDVACDLLNQIFDRIYLRYKPHYLSERRFKENLHEHREIIEALSSGNLKSIRNAFKKHVHHQLDYIISYMQEK